MHFKSNLELMLSNLNQNQTSTIRGKLKRADRRTRLKNRFPSHLHVKFDPWPSTHVPPLKHSEPFGAAPHTSTSSSQVFPAKPSLQKQAYLSTRSTQEPPFRQGREAHSCEWEERARTLGRVRLVTRQKT